MNDWISKFQIALQTVGFNAMRPLSELVLAEPNRAPYQDFTRVVGKNGMGHNLRMGFPTCRWEWDWLPQTDIDVLQGYEAQNVYIRTETDTGAVRRFRYFACYLQPLVLGAIDRRVGVDGNDGLRQKRPVTLEFYGLVPEEGIVDSFA